MIAMHGARVPLLRSKGILVHLALCAGACVMLYPLFWLASSSLKPSNQIFTDTGLWVSEPRLQNYVDGWNGAALPFSVFFANSFTIAALAVLGNVLACSLVAYAFARL
jgi:multiple sugar transport system permease protein